MNRLVFVSGLAALALAPPALTQTWRADNGNGTYTNPLFFDEFSDPDMIRVGSDYYLTGTTMHSMPGLPVLHCRDLVNWTFLSYAYLGWHTRMTGQFIAVRFFFAMFFWSRVDSTIRRVPIPAALVRLRSARPHRV